MGARTNLTHSENSLVDQEKQFDILCNFWLRTQTAYKITQCFEYKSFNKDDY